ncbi:hypothetical protein EDB81DRAFT_773532 [Dactylonectria macrodidyma]|uniref:Uncharacterized protein n=1 Tax=Dactylonectria macrodidyma TaxID=307937 RepID=A0A9P9FTC8_9HYPO|nr:hypothetical protein EDB81DRAFT_773532 [Dactylonectria macrodidyma]
MMTHGLQPLVWLVLTGRFMLHPISIRPCTSSALGILQMLPVILFSQVVAWALSACAHLILWSLSQCYTRCSHES